MATVTLKNSEFLNLESEINGLINQQENRLILRGLINENMKLSTKIKLSDLTKKLAVELNAIQKEYQPFLNEEKQFECELFTQQDLEGAYSEFNYPTFYKLVKSEE